MAQRTMRRPNSERASARASGAASRRQQVLTDHRLSVQEMIPVNWQSLPPFNSEASELLSGSILPTPCLPETPDSKGSIGRRLTRRPGELWRRFVAILFSLWQRLLVYPSKRVTLWYHKRIFMMRRAVALRVYKVSYKLHVKSRMWLLDHRQSLPFHAPIVQQEKYLPVVEHGRYSRGKR